MKNHIKIIGLISSLIIFLFFAVPLTSYFIISIKAVRLEFFSKVFFQSLKISLISSFISLTITVLLGLPAAYFYYIERKKFVKIIFDIAEFPLVIPPSVSGLILLISFGTMGTIGKYLNLLGISIPFTIIAVSIAQIFVGAPLFLKNIRTSFESMDEKLVNTGKILGLNETQIFRKIVVPQNKNAIFSSSIITLSRMLSEFGATIMFAGNMKGVTQTLPLLIYSSMEKDINISIVVGFTLLLISLIIQLLLKKIFNKGDTNVKGRFM